MFTWKTSHIFDTYNKISKKKNTVSSVLEKKSYTPKYFLTFPTKGKLIKFQLVLFLIMYSNMKWDKRLLVSDNWRTFCEHSHERSCNW